MYPNADLPAQFIDFSDEYIVALAQQRNYAYTKESTSPDVESSLYNNPRTDTRELHKLEMTIDGLPCEYYTADYIPVLAKNNSTLEALHAAAPPDSITRLQVQVFAVTLPYEIEDVYVESRTNITLNNILGVSGVVFRHSKRVELEGDFNTFFNVYVPEHEELNAFTILAPNVMVRLLEDAGDYDFEFSRNKVYFYQTFKYFTPGKITITKAAYSNLLEFGINSAKAMARATRPAKLPQGSNNTPMWQLYGMHNAQLIMRLVVIFAAFMFISMCLILPPLWPIGILIAAVFMARYRKLVSKRKRLIDNWHKTKVGIS